MTTPYHDILADIAVRVNALRGAIPATLENTYTNRPLTSTDFGSSIYPFSACISALIMSEERLATTMALTSNPILRAPLHGVTAALAQGAVIPTHSSTNKSIIGVLGSVRDGSDGTTCKEKTLEEIERRNRNAGSFYRLPMYAYKFDGERIEHTRTTVVIDCCVYDRVTQLERATINSTMLLPDNLGPAVICGAVAILIRDDEDVAQAEVYATYYKDILNQLSAGVVPTLSKVPPGPTTVPSSY